MMLMPSIEKRTPESQVQFCKNFVRSWRLLPVDDFGARLSDFG